MNQEINLKIICAQIKKNYDLFGKMDPFCIIKHNNQTHKTQVHVRGGQTPFWNESFKLNANQNDICIVEVYDQDSVGQNDFIGSAKIFLDLNQQRVTKWYPLMNQNVETGQLQTSYFIEQQKPNQNTLQSFGEELRNPKNDSSDQHLPEQFYNQDTPLIRTDDLEGINRQTTNPYQYNEDVYRQYTYDNQQNPYNQYNSFKK